METKETCSGIILAGGLNSRFGGRNKAFVDIGGKTILAHILSVFSEFFEELILVTNDPLAYSDYDIQAVTDIYDIRSSLTGIHAGLFYATRPYAFFTACDTPFLQPDLLRFLLSEIEPKKDIVIPRTQAGFEPLCAAYAVRCLKPVEDCLDAGNLKIQQFFKSVRVKAIPEVRLRRHDPELISFYNVNTPDDLRVAETMLPESPAD